MLYNPISIKNSLDIIWQTQKEILESDKGTNRNTKGYSRLYDITVQMTIHLARDLLAEEAIEMQDKVFLNEEFQKQIKYHIDLLKDRLPEKHPLKEFLIQAQYSPQKMPEGSVELSKFKEQLTGLSPEDIPKNLRYLHTNIVSFIDIAKQPLSQGYNPKEFGA